MGVSSFKSTRHSHVSGRKAGRYTAGRPCLIPGSPLAGAVDCDDGRWSTIAHLDGKHCDPRPGLTAAPSEENFGSPRYYVGLPEGAPVTLCPSADLAAGRT